jgi:hypothetical protein
MKFSEKYDKLNNRLFTTVRRWDPDKESYYRSMIKKEGFGEAGLIQVLKCQFKELTPEFLAYDTEDKYKFDFKPEDLVLVLILLKGARLT